MATVNQYKLWCNDTSGWVFQWAETAPLSCPHDPDGHTLDLDKTTIEDTLAHDQVEIADLATLDDSSSSGKHVLRAAPQPSSPGFFLCSRDFKLCCGELSSSFEDLKVDPSDLKRKSWDELSLVGVYKYDQTSGYIECDDQDDADSNATLSVWDYQPVIQSGAEAGTPCDYEIKGGGLWPQNPVSGTGDEVWDHQMYVIIAPDIPCAWGGSAKFFDGYLKPVESVGLTCDNALASRLDPADDPYGLNRTSIVRVYIYYPAGAKDIHIFRLCTYRRVATS